MNLKFEWLIIDCKGNVVVICWFVIGVFGVDFVFVGCDFDECLFCMIIFVWLLVEIVVVSFKD